jgi:hypothetical protein
MTPDPRRRAVVSRVTLLALVAAVAAACGAPERRDPLADPSLLPPIATRAAVRRPLEVTVATVLDERAARGSLPSEVDSAMSVSAARLVQDYLVRELGRAGTFREVAPEDGRLRAVRVEVTLVLLRGEKGGDVARTEGFGEVELEVKVRRGGVEDPLLAKRYAHRVSESRVLLLHPDPLALACAALKRGVEEIARDLELLAFDPR